MVEWFYISDDSVLVVLIPLIYSFDDRTFSSCWFNVSVHGLDNLNMGRNYLYSIVGAFILALKNSSESAIPEQILYLVSIIELLANSVFVVRSLMSFLGGGGDGIGAGIRARIAGAGWRRGGQGFGGGWKRCWRGVPAPTLFLADVASGLSIELVVMIPTWRIMYLALLLWYE